MNCAVSAAHFSRRGTSAGGCTRHVFAGSTRIASIDPAGNARYYHTDHLGSPRAVTWSRRVLERMSYSAFGKEATTGDARYRFTSKEFEFETGFYFFEARYYDPALGRFISPDSIVPRLFDPQSLNRYRYSRNNPLRLVDPTGHYEFDFGDNFYTPGIPDFTDPCTAGGCGPGPDWRYTLPSVGIYATVGSSSSDGEWSSQTFDSASNALSSLVSNASSLVAGATQWMPHSSGGYVGLGAELGVGSPSVAYNRSLELGVFSGGPNALDVALFTTVGMYTPSYSSLPGDPLRPNFVYGGGAGGGGGMWISNARAPDQVYGRFETYNVAVGPVYATWAIDPVSGTYMLSAGYSRFPINAILWSHYPTNTYPIASWP